MVEVLLEGLTFDCPGCGKSWQRERATGYYHHFACGSCGYRGKVVNGATERGFRDASVRRNPNYATKLTVMVWLERLGEATAAQLAQVSGLTKGQVGGTIGRMLNDRSGARCIEVCRWVNLFPSGKARQVRLTGYGRRYLDAARQYGYVRDGKSDAAD